MREYGQRNAHGEQGTFTAAGFQVDDAAEAGHTFFHAEQTKPFFAEMVKPFAVP